MSHDTGDAEDVAGEDSPAQPMVVACSEELICRAARLTMEAAKGSARCGSALNSHVSRDVDAADRPPASLSDARDPGPCSSHAVMQ